MLLNIAIVCGERQKLSVKPEKSEICTFARMTEDRQFNPPSLRDKIFNSKNPSWREHVENSACKVLEI